MGSAHRRVYGLCLVSDLGIRPSLTMPLSGLSIRLRTLCYAMVGTFSCRILESTPVSAVISRRTESFLVMSEAQDGNRALSLGN